MKKIVSWLLACMMGLSLMACGSKPTEEAAEQPATEKEELIVFAAASMTETLTAISELYKEENPNVDLIFNFDSSGTLKSQIQEGADCDLFISAGQKQMNQLDINADPEINTEGLDFVMTSMFTVILLNQLLKEKSHISAWIGAAASIICLLLFGKDSFLIPAMAVIVLMLTVLRRPIERSGDLS